MLTEKLITQKKYSEETQQVNLERRLGKFMARPMIIKRNGTNNQYLKLQKETSPQVIQRNKK